MAKIDFVRGIAEELNTMFELEPAIDIKLKKVNELEDDIRIKLQNEDTGELELFTSDEEGLDEEVWKYLTDQMGLEPRMPPGKGDKKAKGEEKKMAKNKAGKKKKTTKKSEEAAASKKATKSTKPAAAKKGGEEKKAASKKKAAPKYSREQAIVDVMVKKAQTIDEIARDANKLHVEKGDGKDNVDQTRRLIARYLKPFRFLGILDEKDGKYKVSV